MAGSTSAETHFRVIITSSSFEKKMQAARHRMVYALLKEELAKEGGIHALQLRTRTPEEERRQEGREEGGAEGREEILGGEVKVEGAKY
jgi:BolA protein